MNLHPLTVLSQAQKQELCSAAVKYASLPDFPKNAPLYTRYYTMKSDDGREGTVELVSEQTLEETSSALRDDFIEEMLKYHQLGEEHSGVGSETTERASLLANNHTDTHLRAHLENMQLKNDSAARSVSTREEIATNGYQDLNEEERKDEKDDTLVTGGGTAVSGDFMQTAVDDERDGTIVPDSKLEELDDDYKEGVALVCPTTPVVHLGIGRVTEEIKIMFSYVFSVEAIHSVTPSKLCFHTLIVSIF